MSDFDCLWGFVAEINKWFIPQDRNNILKQWQKHLSHSKLDLDSLVVVRKQLEFKKKKKSIENIRNFEIETNLKSLNNNKL